MLKPQVALSELKPYSTNIMCSLIINKYINCLNQYEYLSPVKFSYFHNIKKNNISKHRKPKIIRFVNYNKYKNIDNLSRKKFLIYSPFQTLKNS